MERKEKIDKSRTKLVPVSKGSRDLAKLSPLEMYLREISRYPLLKPEEEYELAVSHSEEGDTSAAHRLITSNLRLVVKIASDFRRAQVGLLDLIQEGNYGLMQAVKRFNPYKGVKLSSYAAWWIRAYILKYLLDQESPVKLATTAAQRKLFYNLQKETNRLLQEYDSVDAKMIANRLDVPEKDVLEMQKRLGSNDVSLDAPLKTDEGGVSITRGELMSDDKSQPLDDLLGEEQVRELFAEYLDEFRLTLKERDLDVFTSRMMNENPATLQEIGTKYGISRERARQIEARIVKNLRKFVAKKGTLDL